MNKFDAIVIGAGHNGLTCAAYLAKAGKKVLIVERRPVIGSATLTAEYLPGFKYSVFSYLVSLLRPEVIHDLQLVKHGLMVMPLNSTLNPLPDGECLYRDADHYATICRIARYSPRSPDSAYVLLHHYMGELDGAYRAWGFAKGGTGAVAQAIAKSAQSFGAQLMMDMIIPSVIDPDMAPAGQHVMSCFMQYAPYHQNGGWTEEKREAFGEAILDVLATYIPNIRDIILHKQVLTPVDVESIAGISGGNIFHGELSLAQLFSLRPAFGIDQYETPVEGYYQCGSSTHPGGGIMGAPGRLAAKHILNH